MLREKDRAIIEDILDDLNVIYSALAGMKRRDFLENKVIQAAVERKLEIICDSCSKLSSDLKDNILKIDWEDLQTFRNELAHDYRQISPASLWDVAGKTMPILEQVLKKML